MPDSIDGIHVTSAFASCFGSSDLVPARLLPTAGNLTPFLSTALSSAEPLRGILGICALHVRRGCTHISFDSDACFQLTLPFAGGLCFLEPVPARLHLQQCLCTASLPMSYCTWLSALTPCTWTTHIVPDDTSSLPMLAAVASSKLVLIRLHLLQGI